MYVPEHSHPPASQEQECLSTAMQQAQIQDHHPRIWALQQMVVIYKLLW